MGDALSVPSQKLLSVFGLCLFAMANTLAAQGIPGYILQETLLVPVSGSSVTSQTTLLQGITYKLKAVGTARIDVSVLFGAYEQGDAEYAFDYSGGFFSFPSADNCFFPPIDIGLAVNNTVNGDAKNPFWGVLQHRAHLHYELHRCWSANQHQLSQLHLLRQSGTSHGADLSPDGNDPESGRPRTPTLVQVCRRSRARFNNLSLDEPTPLPPPPTARDYMRAPSRAYGVQTTLVCAGNR